MRRDVARTRIKSRIRRHAARRQWIGCRRRILRQLIVLRRKILLHVRLWHIHLLIVQLRLLLQTFLNQSLSHAARDGDRRGANVFLRLWLRRVCIKALPLGHVLRSSAIHAEIIGSCVTGRSDAMIDNERLHHVLLLL